MYLNWNIKCTLSVRVLKFIGTFSCQYIFILMFMHGCEYRQLLKDFVTFLEILSVDDKCRHFPINKWYSCQNLAGKSRALFCVKFRCHINICWIFCINTYPTHPKKMGKGGGLDANKRWQLGRKGVSSHLSV